ncbi:MAG: hypothetical protein ACLVLG_02405 [Anaerovoracaceae bacterium]
MEAILKSCPVPGILCKHIFSISARPFLSENGRAFLSVTQKSSLHMAQQ